MLEAISLDLASNVAGRLELLGGSTLRNRRPRRGGKSEQHTNEVGSLPPSHRSQL